MSTWDIGSSVLGQTVRGSVRGVLGKKLLHRSGARI